MTPKVEQVLHPIIMLLFSFTTVVLHSLLSIQMLIIGRYLRFPMRTIDIIMRRKERKKTRLNQLRKIYQEKPQNKVYPKPNCSVYLDQKA